MLPSNYVKQWRNTVPDLESLLARLIHYHVEFVIVGGFAAIAHGVSLVTQDIDLCCRFTPENLLKLQDAIADVHPVHRLTPQKLPLRLTRENCAGLDNLYIGTDLGVLDCLGNVLGVGDYDDVKEHSVEISLAGGQCRVLDIDSLIKSKEAMNRPRDREAVIQLKAIQEREGLL
jgi:hypothetical protein